MNENRFSVLAAVKGGDPVADIGRFAERFVEAVSVHGYAVKGWEVVECPSPAEVERRRASASLPSMVSAAEFAELCGFSKQRVYELETERRKAGWRRWGSGRMRGQRPELAGLTRGRSVLTPSVGVG